ncbi:hypothetical protein N0V92_001896 [Colletotrichum tropicale]|nr:hypothetical protein N0V92_001896 [Colletotrichum tropicale]
MAVSISRVSFEHHPIALGIGEDKPRISWRFDGLQPNWTQNAYQIEVQRQGSSSIHGVESPDSLLVPWPQSPLASAEKAAVRVQAFGGVGNLSTPWSDWVSVETGLLSQNDWSNAVPIAADRETEVDGPKRPIYFRKSFSLGNATRSKIKSARLYITALGLYEAEINGRRVGDHVMAPGWTSYNFRHVYNTYDVTDLLKPGQNGIGVLVGEGWFSGILTAAGNYRNNYGDTLGVLSLLTVTLADGTNIKVATDDSWQASEGPLASSEIYNGETHDARLEDKIRGWSTGHFNGSNWLATKENSPLKGKLMPLDGPPIRKVQNISPKQVFLSPSGKTLVDFGQNLAGWVKLSVKGPAFSETTNITLHHAEVLENGELALRPLRRAKATDTLILDGNVNQTRTWEPRFTYHGFRYVQVDGWPAEVPLDERTIQAVVIHSDMERTGWFECSNGLLNQFHENVVWSTKGNFFGIPTDCPQRDERLGWTGDAHAFAPTANYLFDTSGFWRGWHRDIWSEMQRQDTMYVPFFVPVIPPEIDTKAWNPSRPSALWGDVAVAGPFNLYQAYGDLGMLQEQYNQSQAWMDKGIPRDPQGLWAKNSYQFGDWLDPKAPASNPERATTNKYLVADAYLIRMTELISIISTALGLGDKAEAYKTQRLELIESFRETWMSNGTMPNRTQTAYALGLDFGIFKEEQHSSAVSTLKSLVIENNYLVGTGFAGTSSLGPALSRNGAVDEFYRMLLQTQVPSWLYQVVMNGTTTWERWDSMLADGSVNPGVMTSFNHYAFGSVSKWIHENIGGVAPAKPGWKKIRIAPVPGGNITSASSRFISPYGAVRVMWEIDDKRGFQMEIEVPPNARAEVTLPGANSTTEEVGSGRYKFYKPSY